MAENSVCGSPAGRAHRLLQHGGERGRLAMAGRQRAQGLQRHAPPASVPDKSIVQRPDASAYVPSPASAIQMAPGPASAAAPTAGKPVKANGSGSLAGNKDRVNPPNLSDAELRAAVDRRNDEIRQVNCKRAREDLAALASGTRLLTLNERGEPVVLDEARQATELARLRRTEQITDCP